MKDRYPKELLSTEDDDGTMVSNVDSLRDAVVGHKIVKAEKDRTVRIPRYRGSRALVRTKAFVLTLDTGRKVILQNERDCSAYTELEAFLLHPESVKHIITGVGTTDGYTRWHIYADYGDVLSLTVGWSCGNPFYYAYGFNIFVKDM